MLLWSILVTFGLWLLLAASGHSGPSFRRLLSTLMLFWPLFANIGPFCIFVFFLLLLGCFKSFWRFLATLNSFGATLPALENLFFVALGQHLVNFCAAVPASPVAASLPPRIHSRTHIRSSACIRSSTRPASELRVWNNPIWVQWKISWCPPTG